MYIHIYTGVKRVFRRKIVSYSNDKPVRQMKEKFSLLLRDVHDKMSNKIVLLNSFLAETEIKR